MRVAVIGTGVTGRAVVDFCLGRAIEVVVCDVAQISPEYKEFLHQRAVVFKDGGYDGGLLDSADVVVISPSVRPENLPCDKTKVISELDFAQRFFDGKIIAITGTNGKTTTVSFINELLVRVGYNSVAAGNIGLPFISVINGKLDWVVLEVSSFQLYGSREFCPNLAIILNIAPDHLNWHKDFDEYVEAKLSIAARMRDDGVLFLNKQDPILTSVKISGPRIRFFQDNKILNEDFAAAKALSDFLGIDEKIFFQTLERFTKPKYRLELIAEFNGVSFINDSKATNVASTIFGLKELKGRYCKVILVCGGSSKLDDFSPVLRFKDLVRSICAYGQEGMRIKEVLGGEIPVFVFERLEDAFELALNQAKQGDAVVLSPMCASFDQYRDYKQRGEHFEQLVRDYICSN